jgi:hypothetical protein
MKVVRRHGALLAAFMCLALLPSLALDLMVPCQDGPGNGHETSCTCACHTPCLCSDPGSLGHLSPVALYDHVFTPPAPRLFAQNIFQPPRA